MNHIDKYRSYMVSQNMDSCANTHLTQPFLPNPAITMSYQFGLCVGEIAKHLALLLRNANPKWNSDWSIFDQELVEQALEEQHWPKKLAEQIAEDKRFFLDELMEDLCGLRPPSWVLIPQMVEVISSLARTGNVILIGHGATVVTADMPSVFHVRLTGSRGKRSEQVQKNRDLAPAEAAKLIKKEDYQRERFIKTYFKARLDNELLYDLTINTDRLSSEEVTALVFVGAMRFFTNTSV
jgi:hypothetical protein